MSDLIKREDAIKALYKYSFVSKDIIERDYRDMHRDISPLKQAEDATLLDSSDMTIDESVQAILDLIK